ncbi:MAG: hypothetical protein K2W85_13485 [Phycisphaerales bacterium]|nr:hypothetical protein [Phycisphaerales bacterium]
MIRWKRTLRTASSERFIALRGQKAVATADVHYLASGMVAGTVVLDESAGWTEEQIPDVLAALDEDMLPEVDQARGTLHYSVVLGEIIGDFEHEEDEVRPAPPPSSGKRRK